MGNLYQNVGQTERAREHYEKRVQLAEQTGDRYRAGAARYNLALLYGDAAGRAQTPAQQCTLWQCARAYAQAALRDFQHYQGRAAADEARAQRLIDEIGQALAGLPA